MTLVSEPQMDAQRDALRRRTVVWVVALATAGLIFDGYDLVFYGTVVSAACRRVAQSRGKGRDGTD
jgi:AAHS family benzoate transporter-like MFS transporter